MTGAFNTKRVATLVLCTLSWSAFSELPLNLPQPEPVPMPTQGHLQQPGPLGFPQLPQNTTPPNVRPPLGPSTSQDSARTLADQLVASGQRQVETLQFVIQQQANTLRNGQNNLQGRMPAEMEYQILRLRLEIAQQELQQRTSERDALQRNQLGQVTTFDQRFEIMKARVMRLRGEILKNLIISKGDPRSLQVSLIQEFKVTSLRLINLLEEGSGGLVRDPKVVEFLKTEVANVNNVDRAVLNGIESVRNNPQVNFQDYNRAMNDYNLFLNTYTRYLNQLGGFTDRQ